MSQDWSDPQANQNPSTGNGAPGPYFLEGGSRIGRYGGEPEGEVQLGLRRPKEAPPPSSAVRSGRAVRARNKTTRVWEALGVGETREPFKECVFFVEKPAAVKVSKQAVAK